MFRTQLDVARGSLSAIRETLHLAEQERARGVMPPEGYELASDRVRVFLLRHTDAADTLRDVRVRLLAAFGPSIRLRLEPSDDEDLLFVRIFGHAQSAEEAASRLEAQLDAWWWTLPTQTTASIVLSLGWEPA